MSSKLDPADRRNPRAIAKHFWREARKKWRQWTTRLRFFVGYTLAGKPQPRVIFMHIPKTAGLSAAEYILRRVGWRRTGRSADLHELPWNLPVPDDKIDKANKAIFVFGHMSFAQIDRLDGRRKNYIFTFLREPRARLWSLYKHLNTYLKKFPLQPVHRSYPLMEKCATLSPEEFFQTADPDILALIDNHMVRQLAGRLEDYPEAELAWPELLERAKANLSRIDFIGFQESFAADFPQLLRQIKIAQPRSIPHANKALDDHAAPSAEAAAAIEEAMDRLTKWDAQLYRFAVDARRRALR